MQYFSPSTWQQQIIGVVIMFRRKKEPEKAARCKRGWGGEAGGGAPWALSQLTLVELSHLRIEFLKLETITKSSVVLGILPYQLLWSGSPFPWSGFPFGEELQSCGQVPHLGSTTGVPGENKPPGSASHPTTSLALVNTEACYGWSVHTANLKSSYYFSFQISA